MTSYLDFSHLITKMSGLGLAQGACSWGRENKPSSEWDLRKTWSGFLRTGPTKLLPQPKGERGCRPHQQAVCNGAMWIKGFLPLLCRLQALVSWRWKYKLLVLTFYGCITPNAVAENSHLLSPTALSWLDSLGQFRCCAHSGLSCCVVWRHLEVHQEARTGRALSLPVTTGPFHCRRVSRVPPWRLRVPKSAKCKCKSQEWHILYLLSVTQLYSSYSLPKGVMPGCEGCGSPLWGPQENVPWLVPSMLPSQTQKLRFWWCAALMWFHGVSAAQSKNGPQPWVLGRADVARVLR